MAYKTGYHVTLGVVIILTMLIGSVLFVDYQIQNSPTTTAIIVNHELHNSDNTTDYIVTLTLKYKIKRVDYTVDNYKVETYTNTTYNTSFIQMNKNYPIGKSLLIHYYEYDPQMVYEPYQAIDRNIFIIFIVVLIIELLYFVYKSWTENLFQLVYFVLFASSEELFDPENIRRFHDLKGIASKVVHPERFVNEQIDERRQVLHALHTFFKQMASSLIPTVISLISAFLLIVGIFQFISSETLLGLTAIMGLNALYDFLKIIPTDYVIYTIWTYFITIEIFIIIWVWKTIPSDEPESSILRIFTFLIVIVFLNPLVILMGGLLAMMAIVYFILPVSLTSWLIVSLLNPLTSGRVSYYTVFVTLSVITIPMVSYITHKLQKFIYLVKLYSNTSGSSFVRIKDFSPVDELLVLGTSIVINHRSGKTYQIQDSEDFKQLGTYKDISVVDNTIFAVTNNHVSLFEASNKTIITQSNVTLLPGEISYQNVRIFATHLVMFYPDLITIYEYDTDTGVLGSILGTIDLKDRVVLFDIDVKRIVIVYTHQIQMILYADNEFSTTASVQFSESITTACIIENLVFIGTDNGQTIRMDLKTSNRKYFASNEISVTSIYFDGNNLFAGMKDGTIQIYRNLDDDTVKSKQILSNEFGIINLAKYKDYLVCGGYNGTLTFLHLIEDLELTKEVSSNKWIPAEVLSNQIYCFICKGYTRENEEFIQCDNCKSYYHKKEISSWFNLKRLSKGCPLCKMDMKL